MNQESTPDRIDHGRAMLNTVEAHRKQYEYASPSDVFDFYADSIRCLYDMYDDIERAYEQGLIRDPHPRQIGTRILPRWEWFLHRIMKRLKLGGIEE